MNLGHVQTIGRLRESLFLMAFGYCWQSEQEGRSVVQFTFRADGAIVREHDVLSDGQPQTGSAGLAGAGFSTL